MFRLDTYTDGGTQCYYAELDGNATVTWADADLTANGVKQALIANTFWKHEIATQYIPYPQSYYTSPLTRCLRTANLTFSGIDVPYYYPFIPTVKELFRESIDPHTCDRRSNRTYIHNLFPTWNIEAGFAEQDVLWNGVTGETNQAQTLRSQIVLDQVFGTDDHTYISITSHSGEIGAILQALGHQPFSLNTGAVIPVLVKAVFMETGPAIADAPYTTSTHCGSPPTTSIGSLAQGCVCKGGVNVTTPIFNTTSTSPATSSAKSSTGSSVPVTSTSKPAASSSKPATPSSGSHPSWASPWPTSYGW